MTSLQEKCK